MTIILKIFTTLIAICFFVFAVSCSQKTTQYSKQSAFSYEGFSEEKSMEGVFHVKFTGVGLESIELVEKLLDRRCAEITLREGYDGFTYYTKSRNDSVGAPSMYAVIHLKKGLSGPDILNARTIVAQPLPEGVEE